MAKIPISEANDSNVNSNYTVAELTDLAIPFIISGFDESYEERILTSFTVQPVGDGSFKGLLRSVLNLGEPNESGFIAYTNQNTLSGVFHFFEVGLSYNDIRWTVDKFHKNFDEDSSNSREGMVKRKLTRKPK